MGFHINYNFLHFYVMDRNAGINNVHAKICIQHTFKLNNTNNYKFLMTR